MEGCEFNLVKSGSTGQTMDNEQKFNIGYVMAEITKARLEDINTIFANLKAGRIEGRMVLDFSEPVRKPVSERATVPA